MSELKGRYFQLRAESEKEVIEEDRNLAQEMINIEGASNLMSSMGALPNLGR